MKITTDKIVNAIDELESDIIISSKIMPIVNPDDSRSPAEVAIQTITCQMLVPDQALELTQEQVTAYVAELQYAYYMIGRLLSGLQEYSPGYNNPHDEQFNQIEAPK